MLLIICLNPNREVGMKLSGMLLAGTAAFALTATAAAAQTEISWWHAMGGTNGERVNKIAADFNASHM